MSDSGATTLFENIGNGEIKRDFYYAIRDYTDKMFQVFSYDFMILPVIMTVNINFYEGSNRSETRHRKPERNYIRANAKTRRDRAGPPQKKLAHTSAEPHPQRQRHPS